MIPKEIEKVFWCLVFVWICLVIGFMSTYIFNMGNNNWVEEMAEDSIEHVSGIEINISGEEEKR